MTILGWRGLCAYLSFLQNYFVLLGLMYSLSRVYSDLFSRTLLCLHARERERCSRTFLCMYQMVSSPTCETWFSVFLSDTECGCKGPVRLCFSTVGCRVDLCHYECLRFSPFLHMSMRTIFVELLQSSHFCSGLSTYDVVSIRRTFCVHVTSLPLLRVLFQDSRDSDRESPDLIFLCTFGASEYRDHVYTFCQSWHFLF